MSNGGRETALSFESRMLRPAGITAIVAGVLILAAFLMQVSVGRVEGGDDAQLAFIDAHSSSLVAAAVLRGVGLALLAFPLYVLFRAAQARAPRVRNAFLVFAFVGPILFGAQSIVSSIALKDVADRFVRDAPPAQTDTAATGKGNAATDSKPGDPGAGSGSGGKGTGADSKSGAPNAADATTKPPRELFAEKVIEDSGMVKVATSLIFPALLAMIFAMVYIPLWAMRTGLLTRFWGTLGMALGFFVLVLPFAVSLWFIALGAIFLGAWPGGRPPAWAAGEAIPWRKAGDPPAADRSAQLERAGLPPDDEPAGDGEPPPPGGPEPRKRKRRR